MKSLLGGELAPITYAWGFIEAPLQSVRDAFHKWRSALYKNVTTLSFRSSLREALLQLQPLTVPPRKELLMETSSSWTAYFDNSIQGGDPFPPISYMAEYLKCRSLAVTCVPHTLKSEDKDAKGTYGAVQFELFAPEPTEFLNYERSISAANDGGHWVFNATGTVQPYEKLAQYQAPRIRDRFTPEMLEEYCASLGIKLFDGDFYGSEAILVEIDDPARRDLRRLTLREARGELGLETET